MSKRPRMAIVGCGIISKTLPEGAAAAGIRMAAVRDVDESCAPYAAGRRSLDAIDAVTGATLRLAVNGTPVLEGSPNNQTLNALAWFLPHGVRFGVTEYVNQKTLIEISR